MRIVILTEGGKDIGFGHLTRCISLYQAFEENGVIPEIAANGDESIASLLKGKRHRVLDRNKGVIPDDILKADIAVVDSYLLGLDLYKKVSAKAEVTAYIDDYARLDYPRGIIINGGIGVRKDMYPSAAGRTYLLGTEYALLRKPFWTIKTKDVKSSIDSILVTFGGDDIRDLTPKVLRFLAIKYPEVKKRVVIGAGFQNAGGIACLKDSRTELVYYPDAEMMLEAMQGSDIAISAGGQTLNELARVGVPAIAVAVSDNQVDNSINWKKAGFIEYAGWWQEGDILQNIENSIERLRPADVRKDMKAAGVSCIDGKGGLRIAEYLLSRAAKKI